MQEELIFFSLDIETDGGVPGMNSMLQLGCAAFQQGRQGPLDTFERNLRPLPGAEQDGPTMLWWRRHQAVWLIITTNQQEPAKVMVDFAGWMNDLVASTKGARPIIVAWPPRFDEAFVNYYLYRFRIPEPYTHRDILDMRSMWVARTILKTGEVSAPPAINRAGIPEEWNGGFPHKHTALADALEQGYIFMNMLEELKHITPILPEESQHPTTTLVEGMK